MARECRRQLLAGMCPEKSLKSLHGQWLPTCFVIGMTPLEVAGLLLLPTGAALAAGLRYYRIRNRNLRIRRLQQRLLDSNC